MKRRYKSAEQIEKLIDRAHARLDKIESMIQAAEIVIRDERTHTGDTWRLQAWREKQANLMKRAGRIKNERLPRLKMKLAEFNTMLLPVIGGEDMSVPV